MSKILGQQEIDYQIALTKGAKLEETQLELLIREFNTILAAKKAKSKEERVQRLTDSIRSAALNGSKLNRYEELVYKLERRTMSEAEQEEFAQLAEEDERLQNERIAYMIELSQLRGVSFLTIKEEFNFNLTTV